MPNIVVIGAGILGSSIAANLAQKDCRVTVLEAAQRPAEGATAKSWAWLNANRKTPNHYAGVYYPPLPPRLIKKLCLVLFNVPRFNMAGKWMQCFDKLRRCCRSQQGWDGGVEEVERAEKQW